MTHLLPAATLCLSALCGSVLAQTLDTRPTAPANPTARAYGPTSGGVAWQRSSDDRRVVGYEITRDGTVVGVRDTLSYVADDLAPGRGYNFAIVAIDSAGQRSDRALARIETPDARPNRPGGLAATLYSSTAVGITWERSGVFGERYEVRRDGEIVAAATNATSYIDTTLSPARPLYLYEVVAVNREGQRSTAARLFVDTREGSSAPPVAQGPSAPRGLRSVVYSATAGAIAWDRSSGAALRYEISRDGQVLSSTDGTSYVDDTLTSGQSHAYAVIAIDRQGRRSDASTVSLVTPPGAATDPVPPSDSDTIIGVGNREEILAEVLEVISGEAYRATYERIEDVLLDEGGRTVISEEIDEDGARVTVAECAGGGRTVSAVSGGAQTLFVEVEVETCRIDGITFDGRLTRDSVFADGAGTSRTVDLTITEADGAVTTVSSESGSSNPLLSSTERFEVSRFETIGPDGPFVVEAARSATSRDDPLSGEPSQRAEFTARVSAPWTGGEPFEIRTEEPFLAVPPSLVDSNEATYTSGVLRAEAADGSRLTLDTSNGDPASVTLTIEASGGTSAFTIPVGADLRIPCTRSTSADSDDLLACSLDPRLPL